MYIDLHIHDSFSIDSVMPLEDAVNEAIQVGLDAICITNHDNLDAVAFAEDYSKKVGFPIFVGVEYYSLEGDILAFGVREIPNERIHAQEFIDFVNEQNGITIAAHPFRNNNRGLETNLDRVKGLTGIEVLNGSTTMEANRTALEYCRRLGLQAVGGSDAHHVIQLGRFATWFPDEVHNVQEFVQVFKTKKCKPAILKGYTVSEDY